MSAQSTSKIITKGPGRWFSLQTMKHGLTQLRHLTTNMDVQSVQQLKKQIRKQIQESLKSLSSDEVARQSSRITSKALKLPEYQEAKSLSIFLSMPGREVSTREIVLQAFMDGKHVYVPYIHASKSDSKLKVMDMLRLKDQNDLDSLQPDAWGIPSLAQDSTNIRENVLGGTGCLEDNREGRTETPNLDLIFMPSVAFDSSLNRLGHGKGFYDRYLSLYRSFLSPDSRDCRMPRLVGLALEQQILPPEDQLPVTELDWRVDAVVTSNDREV